MNIKVLNLKRKVIKMQEEGSNVVVPMDTKEAIARVMLILEHVTGGGIDQARIKELAENAVLDAMLEVKK